MTSLKINRRHSIYTSNVLLVGLAIQSQTEVRSPETEKSNMAARRPFQKWHRWKSTGVIPYTQVMCYCLDLLFKAKLNLESGDWKIQYGRQAAIPKVTSLKINRRHSIYASNVLLFGLAIQSQNEVRVLKLKNPILLPGGHFASDIAAIQEDLDHGHKHHAYTIWSWNSTASSSYALETTEFRSEHYNLWFLVKYWLVLVQSCQ